MTSFLETSVLIRYLTGDDPKKADRCEKFFRQVEKGETSFYLTHLAVAEVIWVLSTVYRFPKNRIVEGLRRVLNTPHIICDEAPSVLAALDLFGSHGISFVDAYHAIVLPTRGITMFYSYDTDFDQISGITRKEP